MGTRWEDLAGEDPGSAYAARLAEQATDGRDMHGEANLVERLLPIGGRVLDAGCGTGRVAIELSRRGVEVVGTDLDPSMLAVAREHAPDIPWHLADLAELDLPPDLRGDGFDVVVAAGNVIPLLAPGTEASVVARLVAHLGAGGMLVAGFGLDAEHLPLDDAHLTLEDYDAWCRAAGLGLVRRWATWDRQPFTDGGYAVSVHHR